LCRVLYCQSETVMRSSSLRRFERDLIDQNPTQTERAGSICRTEQLQNKIQNKIVL